MLRGLVSYQINLATRQDRWTECLQNQAQMGFGFGDITRVEACAEKSYGALGCARSHIKALSRFLTDQTGPYCMILEDDFDFKMPKNDIAQLLSFVEESKFDWDVLLLSGNEVVSTNSPVPFLSKVFEAQTTAGYIVRRPYAAKLLGCFVEAAMNLEKYRGFEPRRLILDKFSIDQAWKNLQRVDDWFIFTPSLGWQRPSFSDVIERQVDYRVGAH